MKLIIQIPCYNEAKTLTVTLNDLPKRIEGIDEIETLVIDDGSKDDTVRVAREWGVNYIISFKQNKGLAFGFMAGLDACLKMGADIIVNTDADNQYCGADIEKLVRPILDRRADIVIGERPIDDIKDFSPVKKKLQHFGSSVVARAANAKIPDAPSGFRAYSRAGAIRINVVNEYTYTLETIVEAGRNHIPMVSVPIRTNPELRKSRLFKSTGSYVRRSMGVIIRSYMMYKPLKFFSILGAFPSALGLIFIIRYLVLAAGGHSSGHIQSLILASMCLVLGILIFVVGMLSDLIASNRKILEDVQTKTRELYYENDKICAAARTEAETGHGAGGGGNYHGAGGGGNIKLRTFKVNLK